MTLTRQQILDIVNRGETVVLRCGNEYKVITTEAQVPADDNAIANCLATVPVYNQSKANYLLNYPIYGTPSDGDSLVFDDANNRFNFAAGGGEGSGAVNSGVAKKLAYYPSTGTTVDDIAEFEYDPTDTNKNFSLTPSSSKGGLTIKEATSVAPTLLDINGGSPWLVNLHTKDAITYYQLVYSIESTGAVVANYINGDGAITFDHYSTAEGENSLLAYGGLAFYSGSSNAYGGIYQRADDLFSIGLVSDFSAEGGNANRINFSSGGVTQYVPGTALSDSLVQPNHLHFFIDEATDTLRVKWKESGGTVLSSILITSASGMTGSGSIVFANTPSITTPHISGTLFASGSSGIQFGDGGGTAGATTGFISPVSDGVFRIGDSAGGGSPHIIFGSNSSSFVRVKRSGTALAVRLGDDSADGDITARGGTFTGALLQTSNSATAFASGPNGATNPVFQLVNNVSSAATGISITGNAAGGGVNITALSSGTNEGITISAKGTGNISLTANRVGSTTFQATSSSGGFITVNNAPIRLGVSSLLTWASNSDSTVGADIFLRRVAAANLAFGNVDSATPVNQIISTQGSRAGTDSNVSGGNLTILSGLGTGNSTPSSLILQSPLIGSSGTAAQVATTGLTIINGSAKLTSYTVSGLPSASVCGAGAKAFVTDSNATMTAGIGATVAGGGSNKVPVYSDGTNWIIG